VLVLRRIYRAPELFQLLATFAVVLIIKDIALCGSGAPRTCSARARPACEGRGRDHRPAHSGLRPTADRHRSGGAGRCCGCCSTRTRWGTLVRAATQDREMVGALGVDQAWLFTSVFFLGSLLAGLGGALQIPREPANLAHGPRSSPTPSWWSWSAAWAASRRLPGRLLIASPRPLHRPSAP
jgi:branched-chain amino acid transport system permease protein